LEEENKRLAKMKKELYSRFNQIYVPVLMFMDRDPAEKVIYYAVKHEENRRPQVKIQSFNPDLELQK